MRDPQIANQQLGRQLLLRRAGDSGEGRMSSGGLMIRSSKASDSAQDPNRCLLIARRPRPHIAGSRRNAAKPALTWADTRHRRRGQPRDYPSGTDDLGVPRPHSAE